MSDETLVKSTWRDHVQQNAYIQPIFVAHVAKKCNTISGGPAVEFWAYPILRCEALSLTCHALPHFSTCNPVVPTFEQSYIQNVGEKSVISSPTPTKLLSHPASLFSAEYYYRVLLGRRPSTRGSTTLTRAVGLLELIWSSSTLLTLGGSVCRGELLMY